MDHIIYDDRSPAWTPFALIAIICGMVLWGGFWENANMVVTAWTALVIGIVLLLLILAQGRLYWKTEICRLALAGGLLEVVTNRWVGASRTLNINPSEATNWRTVARSADDKRVPNLKVTIGGQDYDMSMASPKLVDLDGLRTIAPRFFSALEASYPALISQTL